MANSREILFDSHELSQQLKVLTKFIDDCLSLYPTIHTLKLCMVYSFLGHQLNIFSLRVIS